MDTTNLHEGHKDLIDNSGYTYNYRSYPDPKLNVIAANQAVGTALEKGSIPCTTKETGFPEKYFWQY